MATNSGPPPPAYDPKYAGVPPGSQPPPTGFPVPPPPPPANPNQPPPPHGSYPQQPYIHQPAPYPGYPPQQQQNTTVMMQTPVMMPQMKFGEHPIQMTCSVCSTAITTRTERKIGTLTWLIFAGLCFFGCWLCSCIPFCVSECKDVVHSCPNCNAVVGRYKRLD